MPKSLGSLEEVFSTKYIHVWGGFAHILTYFFTEIQAFLLELWPFFGQKWPFLALFDPFLTPFWAKFSQICSVRLRPPKKTMKKGGYRSFFGQKVVIKHVSMGQNEHF